MEASIVVAAHNEGTLLAKTVESVREIAWVLDLEIVVVDDGSTDGSGEDLARRAPEVRVIRNATRRGTSPSKDQGARSSRADILIFLDAHTKPEDGAIFRLIEGVRELDGEAIVTPRVPVLDTATWTNLRGRAGYGYNLILPDLDGRWLGLSQMRRYGRFYESPSLCGCCFAISRWLYEKLGGFDPYMIEWGPEDLDLGLKSWLLGHPVLCDPLATIGHRFIKSFPYHVAPESILANKMRIARKNFSEEGFRDWLTVMGSLSDGVLWKRAQALFGERRESAEAERARLLQHRLRDERWFAREFACKWPTLAASA